MKRLFILIAVCMIGMVLPQSVFAVATVTVSGTTVTINTDKAGELKTYLQSASDADKAAIRNASSIVFDGKFNKDDLEALKNAECCTQSTVDMSEAKFVKGAGGGGDAANKTFLYHDLDALNNDNDPQHRGEGVVAIVNGTIYTSGTNDNGATFEWIPTNYTNGTSLSRNNITQRHSELPEPIQGDYSTTILVGGTEYVFIGGPADGSWVEASQAGDGDLDFKDMSFENWGSNVTKAITSKYVDPNKPLAATLCKGCTALTDLTISSGRINKIYEGSKPPLQKLTIGNKVTQIGSGTADGGFANFTTIKEVIFEEGGTDPLVFKANCFLECSNLEKITIPARSTLIETMAFGKTGLKEVTFEATTEPADPLVIKYQAFENSKAIRDVYVNVDPDLKALVCEYNAFDFEVMDGQTSPEHYEDMATLHFDKLDKEFYKGEWKEGFGFTQTELLAIRGENNQSSETITALNIGINYVNDNKELVGNDNKPKTHTGDQYNGYSQGYLTKRPANGWKQFAKTGNEIPVLGDFLRSYSTATPYHMPTYGTSGTPIVKIYRIWKFEDGYEKGMDLLTETPQTKAYAREVKDYIPNYTGLIMVGITDKEVLYNFKLYNTGTVVQYPFTDQVQGNVENSNLLVPSNDQTLVINPTDKSGSEITYRNFGFKVYETGTRSATTRSTKTGKFLRAKIGTKITPNHSYLKLYKDFYHWKNEHGGVSNYDAEIYEEVVGNAKISFIYDLGEDEEEFGGIATVIRKAIEEADMEDGEFYTLQGVKVNKPTTKGVYIHNGKKVLVK